MAVRTKRLVAHRLTAASATIYTAPSGETVIVKEATFYNEGAANQAGALSVVLAGGGGEFFVMQPFMGATTVTTITPRFLVLQPGDALKVYRTLAAAMQVHISGTELEGVAD